MAGEVRSSVRLEHFRRERRAPAPLWLSARRGPGRSGPGRSGARRSGAGRHCRVRSAGIMENLLRGFSQM